MPAAEYETAREITPGPAGLNPPRSARTRSAVGFSFEVV